MSEIENEDDAEFDRRTPAEIIGHDRLNDLWGEGFTVVHRLPSFEVPEHITPHGVVYQWSDAVAPPVSNWERVPAERHPGLFAPYGYEGDIVVGGMVLCERPKAEVDAFHAEAARKAEKNVTDWIEKQSDNGIAGHVS